MSINNLIIFGNFVALTNDQYNEAAQLALLDSTIYSWGHCGPVYFGGRIVVRIETIGM